MSIQSDNERGDTEQDWRRIALSPSRDDGAVAELLRRRRSTKSYLPDHISFQALSRLLRATIGVVPAGQRPYGSAQARYDVAVTVVAAAVEGLAPAVYLYLPAEHVLVHREKGDHRSRLARGTLDAGWLTQCPVVLLLSADLSAANRAFGDQGAGRGESFCWFEAGLVGQNIYLWAAENSLGTVFLGGLDSVEVQAATRRWIPQSHTVLGMLPVGRPADAEASST